MPSASLSVAMASSLCNQRKDFFVEMQLRFVAGLCGFGSERCFDLAFGGLHLIEQIGADGKEIASGEQGNLLDLAEAGAHDLSFVAVLLEIVVNAGDGRDAGVLIDRDFFTAVLGFVVIVNAADEWRDESDFGFGAGYGLGKTKEQSEIAVDAFLLEFFGSFDTFPSAGYFDENSFTIGAAVLRSESPKC